MVTPDFEILDHTADIGVIARGQDLKEAFANAAYGMFSIMAELENVAQAETREITVAAEDRGTLLVEWLGELLYLFDVEHILFRHFEILDWDGSVLKAKASGEVLDPQRHRLKMSIKAITYHMLEVKKENGWQVRVIFDV